MNNQSRSDMSKQVAIVVPLSNRNYLTDDEEISLKHLRYHLGHYDKYILIPENLDFSLPDFGTVRFDNKYFGSAIAHRDLLFSREYYEAFSDYEFMLSYHLDVLVFSDELREWCDKDYDFIGPPWVKHEDAPYYGNSNYEGKVGNGGFSLKKVSSFLSLLDSKVYAMDPEDYWNSYHAHKHLPGRILNWPKKLLMSSHRFNNVAWEIKRWSRNDDLFIADRARHYFPEFKIAPVDDALRFGFECVPRYCYELTGHKLPFGCHAWERYDRDFWEQFLLE
jgi:hypothetical protein